MKYTECSIKNQKRQKKCGRQKQEKNHNNGNKQKTVANTVDIMYISNQFECQWPK